ncbi:SCF E3 ubiquitin ligase complex F-box protein grrA [Cryomyces minteri]|uniref:SCF E3 ubiquitin ligase complex F-box protein grrA n=2 Tax=Cryomyces minteri TaxID=331657 RepID=A0A4U0XWV4_9PEZI|nr:SCF E3 ubiquitin ligase complex F-box protein grrA [Cryomyces minteri]
MSRSRRLHRLASHERSDSSSSTSPEREDADDDNDSFMQQLNDSQSSLGLSISQEVTPDSSTLQAFEERCRVSPVCRLPAELLISIFAKLSSPADLKACMLVSKDWARNSVGLLWHRPQTNNWDALHNVVQSIRKVNAYFVYHDLVKRLNLSTLGSQVSDGTLLPLSGCKRIERLTLTNCNKLTDQSLAPLVDGNRSLLALDVTGLDSLTDRTLKLVANNCLRLQGLNVTNCRKITDESLEAIAKSCRHLKRLKFNGCSQITDRSILEFANNCRQMLEIDLHDCRLLEDVSVTALVSEGRQLRELRLAHCTRITDNAFLNLPLETVFESLRILDLTDCGELQDSGVQKIVTAAPRLRNLVLAKCRQITDRAVFAITKLGKNLHYIHLGHCARITDAGVNQLVRQCNRIRYIDLACCSSLTDNSVQQLATLPKLKRIGLVKCGQITDRSITALAKPKAVGHGVLSASSLERVHLSYCTNLTLAGIHALLNNCPHLTHLSLTGVAAFLREDLIVFCREAPPEFNDHQRDVFCVFSGNGVNRLREYLNVEADTHALYEHAMDDEGLMVVDVDTGSTVANAPQQVLNSMAAPTPAPDDVDEEDDAFGEGSDILTGD